MRRSVLSIALVLLTALVAGVFASNAPTQAQAVARVTIVHLAPFAEGIANTAVTIVVNDDVIASGVQYKQYLSTTLAPGTYDVAVFAGTDLTATPAMQAELTLEAGRDYTVFAGGDGANIPLALNVLQDDNTVPGSNDARVRIVHAAPFAAPDNTGVDILSTPDNTIIAGLEDVRFGVASPYLTLGTAAPTNVAIVATGTTEPAIITASLDLPALAIVTVFAIGGANGFAPEAFVLPGGPRMPAQIRVAHLAPFAPGAAAVNATVQAAIPVQINGFAFGQTTAYLPLPDDLYLIDIRLPGEETPVASGGDRLLPGMRYTALALGGANDAQLELVLLTDPTTPPAEGKARLRVYHAAPFAAGDAANVSIRTKDGAVVGGLSNVPYKGTATLELDPGFYDLVIASPDGTTTLLDIPPFLLEAGSDITLFAIGDGIIGATTNQASGPNQNLRTLILGEDATNRLFLPIITTEAGATPMQ
jgi:hypothetical protein